MKNNNNSKRLRKTDGSCSCCTLSYWQGGVFGSLTIILERKDTKKEVSSIDIPLKELPILNTIISRIIKVSKI